MRRACDALRSSRMPNPAAGFPAIPCDECDEPCALTLLPAGIRARIVRFACAHGDASRLRVLGVFEGTPVRIVDDRCGVVLDVRGTRVAIAASLAVAIIGIPIR